MAPKRGRNAAGCAPWPIAVEQRQLGGPQRQRVYVVSVRMFWSLGMSVHKYECAQGGSSKRDHAAEKHSFQVCGGVKGSRKKWIGSGVGKLRFEVHVCDVLARRFQRPILKRAVVPFPNNLVIISKEVSVSGNVEGQNDGEEVIPLRGWRCGSCSHRPGRPPRHGVCSCCPSQRARRMTCTGRLRRVPIRASQQ